MFGTSWTKSFLAIFAIVIFCSLAAAQSSQPPLQRSDFTEIGPQGFGDRQNSWSWGAAYFNGKLLVGTNRAMDCVDSASQHNAIPLYPYPPSDPDVSCTADSKQLPLQAEIWSWDPSTRVWTRVYQSPNDVKIPGTNPAIYTSEDQGFRGMFQYTETDGTKALYVSSCSAKMLYPSLQGGRILRSTDGVNFTVVPHDKGTFLGNLGNACFRGMESFNGKLYANASTFQGPGTLVESADPAKGNNSWRQVVTNSQITYESRAFNGYLYTTFTDAKNGFGVGKTAATGNPPYPYQMIFTNGGNATQDKNRDGLTLTVFQGNLYVGGNGVNPSGSFTNQGAEMFRIHPDDTWDLLVGNSRNTPAGQKNSLSGLGAGFSWPLNDHMWQITEYDGRLYAGTFDDSTVLRLQQPSLSPEFGFDLWWSPDGVYWALVDQNGFGDKFNFGVRRLTATPYGLFVGSANFYYGTRLYMGYNGPVNALKIGGGEGPAPAAAVQVETTNGQTLVSWKPAPQAARYHVMRRLINFAPANNGRPSAGPIEEVGTVTTPVFRDASASPLITYVYHVIAEDAAGHRSVTSNMAQSNLGNVPLTFATLLSNIQDMQARGNFKSSSGLMQVLSLLNEAKAGAARGDLSGLQKMTSSLKSGGGNLLVDFALSELLRMTDEMTKRAQLAHSGYLPASSL